MNLNWLQSNLIYLTVHGSQCYGLNDESSDLDVKGICIPPANVEYGLFNRFEQSENNPDIEQKYGYMRNYKNPKFESTIYSLRKFFILSSNVNPNIIELLWTDQRFHLAKNPIMLKIFNERDKFLSSKAKFTFSGYAYSQLARIERHRKWILKGDMKEPTRENFGLPSIPNKQVDEIFKYVKSQVEKWNLNQYPIDEMQRADLKETIWEIIWNLSNKSVSWDNWPDAYSYGVINKLKEDLSLKDEVVDLIQKERLYAKEVDNYKSWLKWKSERNPYRRDLEIKFGMDVKHAMHLVRLLRMGYEILTQNKVIVKREDREELLSIKHGAWSYNKIMEYSIEMQKKLDEVYESQKKLMMEGKPTIVRWSVDFEEINKLYHLLYKQYWDSKFDEKECENHEYAMEQALGWHGQG